MARGNRSDLPARVQARARARAQAKGRAQADPGSEDVLYTPRACNTRTTCLVFSDVQGARLYMTIPTSTARARRRVQGTPVNWVRDTGNRVNEYNRTVRGIAPVSYGSIWAPNVPDMHISAIKVTRGIPCGVDMGRRRGPRASKES